MDTFIIIEAIFVDGVFFVWVTVLRKIHWRRNTTSDKMLTLVLLNCFNCIFRHLKLELLTQFPASNDEKYYYL